LIGKLKIAFAGVIILALLIAGTGIYLLSHKHKGLVRENKGLASEIAALQYRLKLTQEKASKVLQKKEFYTSHAEPSESQEKPLSQVPLDCSRCFESTKMEIELEDEKGWWSYHDPNAFDDKPGTFTLTDRFFSEAIPPAIPDYGLSGKKPAESLGGTRRIRRNSEKAISAGIGLSGYELEMSYSPFGIQGKNWSLGIELRSRLLSSRPFMPSRSFGTNYSNQPDFNPYTLQADLGLGITLRW